MKWFFFKLLPKIEHLERFHLNLSVFLYDPKSCTLFGTTEFHALRHKAEIACFTSPSAILL